MKSSFFRTIISLQSLFLLVLLLSSCSTIQYSDIVDCSYITSSIKQELPLKSGYSEYSSDEVKYIIDPSLYDSCSIIYSDSSDDIDEIGVIHANEGCSELLLKEVMAYVDHAKQDKHDFLRNYLPNELDKLDSGEVKQFGNYVVFAFSDNNKEIFKRIANILS